MIAIKEVNIIEFYSGWVEENLLKDMLLGSECSSIGKICLILEAGKKFMQEGPFIIPPVRWLDSFEYNAEFVITCEADEIGEDEIQRLRTIT